MLHFIDKNSLVRHSSGLDGFQVVEEVRQFALVERSLVFVDKTEFRMDTLFDVQGWLEGGFP